MSAAFGEMTGTECDLTAEENCCDSQNTCLDPRTIFQLLDVRRGSIPDGWPDSLSTRGRRVLYRIKGRRHTADQGDDPFRSARNGGCAGGLGPDEFWSSSLDHRLADAGAQH